MTPEWHHLPSPPVAMTIERAPARLGRVPDSLERTHPLGCAPVPLDRALDPIERNLDLLERALDSIAMIVEHPATHTPWQR